MLHIPGHWIAVGAVILLGFGILSGVKAMAKRFGGIDISWKLALVFQKYNSSRELLWGFVLANDTRDLPLLNCKVRPEEMIWPRKAH